MKIALLVLATVAALAAAQNHTKPTWPQAYSSSVLMHELFTDKPPRFFRQFVSYPQNKGRVDGTAAFMGQEHFISAIFDHGASEEYILVFTPGTVECFRRPISHTLPKPDFDSFKFIGLAIVFGRECDHWEANNTAGTHFYQYYDTHLTHEPRRVDLSDVSKGVSLEFDYFEFDAGSQDPSLWQIPPHLNSFCTPVSGDSQAHATFDYFSPIHAAGFVTAQASRHSRHHHQH